MLFSELYKIMVNEATFVGFKGGDRPKAPLDPPWLYGDVQNPVCFGASGTDKI